MGRTNDAIIYGGRVQLFVSGSQGRQALADQLPSLKSKDYGDPFADIFAAVKGDFYAIDRMLFSPAKVTVTALEFGRELRGRPHRHGDPVPLLLLLTGMAAEIVLFCERKKWHGRSISRALRAVASGRWRFR